MNNIQLTFFIFPEFYTLVPEDTLPAANAVYAFICFYHDFSTIP